MTLANKIELRCAYFVLCKMTAVNTILMVGITVPESTAVTGDGSMDAFYMYKCVPDFFSSLQRKYKSATFSSRGWKII